MRQIDDAVALIRRSGRIVLAAHVSPDADAIGSMLGLGHGLRWLGKEIALICDDPVPAKLRFLPESDLIKSNLPDEFGSSDLLIGLDASDPQRLGETAASFLAGRVPVLVIDHHSTNLQFGTVNLVEEQASATSEVVVAVLDSLGVPLTPETAACLLAGIVGDTRSFSTSSVTSSTLVTASRLVGAGADLSLIVEEVFNRRTLQTLRLWGLGLDDLHFEDGVLWVAIGLDERRKAGLVEANDSGLANLLLTAEEARISVVFTEEADGIIDISFRARDGSNVASTALALGGGGHVLAAGCEVSAPLGELIPRVMRLLRENNPELPSGRQG